MMFFVAKNYLMFFGAYACRIGLICGIFSANPYVFGGDGRRKEVKGVCVVKITNKLRYFMASALMLFSTISPLGSAVPRAYAEDTLPEPVTKKTIVPNGDGTYKITLSVTGKASSSQDNTKANIVVVFDSSGSMSYSTTENRYEERNNGRFGKVDGNYVQLYYQSTNYWGEVTYREVGDYGNHSTVYYRDESSDSGYTQYNGTRYAQVALNRLSVAKTAVNGLAEKLLAYNTTTGVSDMVQMAFIDFASNVKTDTTHTTPTTSAPTTSLNTFKSWVNATTADGGTNWEDALTAANNVSFGDNDPVYIIFVSDGNPTFRNSRYNNRANDCDEYQGYGNNRTCVRWGSGSSDPNGYNLGAAQNVAATIVTSKTLYSVGVFGDVSNMQNLNSNAIYKDAANQAALEAAFNDIVKAITNSLSLTGVTFTDGITGMTEAVIEGKAGDFTYMKGGSVWTDAPAATYDEDTKTVKWNLGETVLQDGETASISFNVYPSQESIDLVADLNNGKKSYDSLTDAQKAQIVQSGSTYSLKTNTDSPSLKYKVVQTTTVNGVPTTTTSPEKEITIENPPAVGLPTDKITLEKLWEDSLDPSQREEICEDAQGNPLEVCEVVMDFYKDGQKYNPYNGEGDDQNPAIHITKNTNWKLKNYISIAPGLMVAEGQASYDDVNHQVVTFNGTKYAILRTGHEYYFDEHDINSHYQLTNYRYQPMEILYDGELKLMNVKFTKDSDGKITAVESMTAMTTVSATNTIKGGVNISKKVLDEDNNEITDSKDAFDIKVTLKKPDGTTAYSDTDYRIYYGENNPEYESHIVYEKDAQGNFILDENGNKIIKYSRTDHIKETDGVIEESLYVGDTIRVVNVDTDVLYYVEESNIPKGYSLNGIDYKIKYGADGAETNDTVAKTVDGKNYYAVKGNSASSAAVTNKYVSGNLEISKTVNVTSGNATTAKAKKFGFQIKLYTDNTKANELTTPYKVDGKDLYIKSGDTFTLGNGESIKLLRLPEGAYYEIVEKGVYSGDELLEFTESNNYGYAQSSTGATGEIVKNTTKTAAFTNTYSVSGKVTIQAKKDLRGRNWLKDETFIFNLTGNGQDQTAAVSEGKTAEFEVPINNTGTFEYIIVEDIADMKGGLTRQTAKITAVVVATDNGDGTLSFTTAYRDGDTLECGEDEEDCDTTQNVIVNTYSSEGSIELGASKILTGRDWKDGEQYTFTLLHGTDVLGNEVVNKDKTTVTFDKITYTTEDVGNTFVYIIRETSTLPGGVTNSGDITATVTLTDNNDGTITTTVVYTDKDGKETNTIINTYSATGNVVLKANKALVGRDWKEGETYYFVLKNESGTEIERVPVKKDGEISFTALNFTLADVGTHTYTITEEGLPTNEGMAKSDDITVTIIIEDAGEGRLGIVESYSATTITNTYTSAGEITLQATKKLTGREWLDSDAFTFTLSGEGIEEQNRQATNGNKTVTFGKITYDQDDVKNKTTYTYTISETAGYQGKGLTKSGDITATVTLSDDGKGHISTSVVYKNADNEESNIIENTYATSGSVVLEANKKLTGRPWDTDESYTFALKQGDTVIETKEVSDGNLHVEFKEIEYTAAGTYTYKIEETDTLPSYMSQNGPITVTVEVTDDNAGHLTATPRYSIEDKTITNTYTATGSVQLEATKKIDGRDWLDTDEFDFELSGGNLTEPQTITLNKDKQKAVFDVINYTEKDIAETYTYTIKETSAMPAGMTAGDALTVTVTVEDNKDGTLKATAIYSNEEKVITNTYEANGKIQLEATKEIVGRDWMKDLDEFEFKLSGNGVEDTQTVDVDHKTVKFEELSFDQSDAGKTYTYTIEETTDLSDLSMTNSGVITVKVTVTDKGNGELEVSAVYEGGEGDKKNTIVNTYTANGTAGLDVKKVLEGRKWQSGESFEFGVFAEGSNDPIRTGTATEDSQLIHFDLIEYDQDDYLKSDTYTYTIREISDLSGKGFGEPNEVVATVTLTDDGKGNIESSVSYTNDDTINNIYSAEGSIALKAEKAFVGARTWQEGECFSFVLKDESGDIDTQQVCADGEVTFEALNFTEEDIDQTYTYTIAEDDNLPAGVSNDGDITVTVKISDNLDGSLKVTAEYAKGEEKTNKIINTYETSSTDVTFHVDKSIDNQSGSDLDGKEFKFELVNADTNEVIQTITITTDGETGEADFDAIEYTKVGTHNYIIREVNDEQPGFSYDESEYKIKVEVTDNYNEAQLEAKTTITLDGAETSDIKFENPYKAEETSAVISVTKILEGMNEGVEAVDFEFVLTNEDGEEETITIKPVDGEGEGEFSEITFDKVGEYIYTVRENNTEEPGYTYDDSEFTVIINVEDNNGELVATVSYLKDDEEADGISFTNYYATEDLIYEGVIMKKVLEGRDLQDGEFSFEIYLDGELVTAGHNDADGVIIFDDPITFTEPGTYTFTVKENTDEEIEFVTFDENEYEFTIEVIDNGMGELEVVEDTSSEVIFTNKYEEPEPGKGENPRTLDDIMSAVAVFVISLFGLIGSVIFGKRFLKEEE
jgi:pilin isopeptide linkage protein